jgi:hypothetical protein
MLFPIKGDYPKDEALPHGNSIYKEVPYQKSDPKIKERLFEKLKGRMGRTLPNQLYKEDKIENPPNIARYFNDIYLLFHVFIISFKSLLAET